MPILYIRFFYFHVLQSIKNGPKRFFGKHRKLYFGILIRECTDNGDGHRHIAHGRQTNDQDMGMFTLFVHEAQGLVHRRYTFSSACKPACTYLRILYLPTIDQWRWKDLSSAPKEHPTSPYIYRRVLETHQYGSLPLACDRSSVPKWKADRWPTQDFRY